MCKLKRHEIRFSDGSKACWDIMCDEYGMMMQITVSFYDKDGKVKGEPLIMNGL